MKEPRFKNLIKRSMEINDNAFAETVALFFYDNQGKIDPNKPMIEVEAILRVGEGKTTSIAGTGGGSWRTRIIFNTAELHIDRIKYPNIPIRTKDKVRAVMREGKPWFTVAIVDDRNIGRLSLQLGVA